MGSVLVPYASTAFTEAAQGGGPGDWTRTGGANDAAALTDGSLATYIGLAYGSSSQLETIYNTFAAPTIPAGAVITSFRASIKFDVAVIYPGSDPAVSLSFYLTNLIDNTYPISTYVPATTALSYAGVGYVYTADFLPPTNLAYASLQSHAVVGSYGSNNSSWRIYEMTLKAFYHERPVVSTVTLSSATSSIPTVSWTYTDPDGDAQNYFSIRVFTTAVASAGGFDPTTGLSATSYTAHPSAVFDYAVNSNAPSFTIPPGYLTSGISYRIFVFASDGGCVAMGNTYHWSATAAYASTTATQLPILSPSIDTWTTPGVGDTSGLTAYSPLIASIPIVVRARPNILDYNDAGFENVAGTATVANWVPTPTTSSVLTSTLFDQWKGSSALHVTSAGGGGTSGADSEVRSVQPGQISTIIAHVLPKVTARSCTLTVTYLDKTSTLIDTATTTQTEIDTTHYLALSLTAAAPYNAAFAYITVKWAATAGSEVHVVDCVSWTHGELNVVDNAGFEAQSAFWYGSVAGGNTIAIASDTSSDDPGGAYAMDLNLAFPGNSCRLRPGGYVADNTLPTFYGMAGAKWFLSSQMKLVASFTTSNGELGWVLDDATTVGFNTFFLTPTWTRNWTTVDLTASTRRGYPIIQPDHASITNVEMRADAVQMERIWTFTDGTFETAVLKYCRALGEQQGWIAESPHITIDGTTAHGGTKSLKVGFNSGDDQTTDIYSDGYLGARASQYFSCAGYTAVQFAWWWKFTTANVNASVSFYDHSGSRLSSVLLRNASGTQAAFTFTSPPSITPPTGAAYGRIIFNAIPSTGATASLWVDDVVPTFTGTLTPSAYLDGGWSQGGGAAVEPTLDVERSADFVPSGDPNIDLLSLLIGKLDPTRGTHWGYVRFPPYAAAPAQVIGTLGVTNLGFKETYNDYEWPLQLTTDTAKQTLYYRARMLIPDPANAAALIASPWSRYLLVQPASHPLRIQEWLLIDPLYPADNIVLGVKKIKWDTPETGTQFVGVGRNRALVVADQVMGDTISIDLTVTDQNAFKALKNQYLKQSTLLLRSPDGESWYVRTTKRTRDRTWLGSYTVGTLRTVTLEFVEVDPVP